MKNLKAIAVVILLMYVINSSINFFIEVIAENMNYGTNFDLKRFLTIITISLAFYIMFRIIRLDYEKYNLITLKEPILLVSFVAFLGNGINGLMFAIPAALGSGPGSYRAYMVTYGSSMFLVYGFLALVTLLMYKRLEEKQFSRLLLKQYVLSLIITMILAGFIVFSITLSSITQVGDIGVALIEGGRPLFLD